MKILFSVLNLNLNESAMTIPQYTDLNMKHLRCSVGNPDPEDPWIRIRINLKCSIRIRIRIHLIRIHNSASSYFMQCCGSGIRCLFDPGIRDG